MLENKAIPRPSEYEKLEIKEFILDANLSLITNSFITVSLFATLIYYMTVKIYINNQIESMEFFITSAFYVGLLAYLFIGYLNIRSQKRLISNLETIFEDTKEYKADDLNPTT